eukprot:TRINITY_DN4045_c0_g1_i1.p1 TRINITY_DN4045_c0_g1~~TRINITY_DN4045_c0_g1_i1.p1  ORF type:complete len:164 (+),score=20.04 TRINITY_DN4045_c0_g1_i1:50-493(+)
MSNRTRSAGGVRRYATPQFVMGTLFTGMGLAVIALPDLTLRLSVPHEFLYRGVIEGGGIPASTVLMAQCFGAQASLAGLLILSSKFTASTYRVFGLAMAPFFAFDVWGYAAGRLTAFGALGDGFGNLVFSVCCYLGWRKCIDNAHKD